MLDLAGDRVFAWAPGPIEPERQKSLSWLDAGGMETPIDIPKGALLGGRISPDGAQLLVAYHYQGKEAEVIDVSRGSRRNVTFNGDTRRAIWGPGPERITFVYWPRRAIEDLQPKDRRQTGEPEVLWDGGGFLFLGLGSWSRDGKTLAFIVHGSKGNDIWLMEEGNQPRPFVASGFDEMHPDFSPDGRWLVYSSNEPARTEVFVKPLTGDGPARQVSVGGGSEPLWARDGSAIFYWDLTAFEQVSGKLGGQPSALFRVRVNPVAGGLDLATQEKVLEALRVWAGPGQSWDVAPDGRFRHCQAANRGRPPSLV